MLYDTITREDHDGMAGDHAERRPDVMNALKHRPMRAEITHAVSAAGRESAGRRADGRGGGPFARGKTWGDRANVANLNLERTLRDEYIPMLMAIVGVPGAGDRGGQRHGGGGGGEPRAGLATITIAAESGRLHPGLHADRPDPRRGWHVGALAADGGVAKRRWGRRSSRTK